jgi:hypothetical protein
MATILDDQLKNASRETRASPILAQSRPKVLLFDVHEAQQFRLGRSAFEGGRQVDRVE